MRGTSLRGWLVGVGVLALALRLPLLLSPGEGNADLSTYLVLAEGEALRPTRTPGYPMLLWLLDPLPGGLLEATEVLQHLVGIGLVLAMTALCWRWFGRAIGAATGVVAALSPLLAFTERALTPDLLFGALAAAGAAVVVEGALRSPPSLRLLAPAGALFGLAAYMKPVALPLALTPLLPLAIATRSLRQTLAGTAVTVLVVALLVTPWVIRNWVRYDEPTMSTLSGVTLFVRAFDQDELPVPTDTEEGRLAARLRERVLAGGRDVRLSDTGDAVLAGLTQKHGYSIEGAQALEGRVARRAIRRHLGTYAVGTAGNVVDLAWDGIDRGDVRDAFEEDTEGVNAVARVPGRVLAWLGGALGTLLWVASGAVALVLLLPWLGSRRARIASATLLSAWALVALATAATTWPGYPRFAGQLVPLLLPLAVAAPASVAAAISAAARARRGAC